MKGLISTTAAFVAVVLTGGIWIGIVSRMPAGGPNTGIAVMGGVFAVAFMWLLVLRLRRLLARPDQRWLELTLLVFNFAVLIVAFAWVHHRIGLMDFSGPAPRGTTDFGDALYFSIITITTVGYGDFIPVGAGRAVAAMQGLLGYFILGILVSTGFQLIAPNAEPGRDPGEEKERQENRSDGDREREGSEGDHRTGREDARPREGARS